MTATDHPRLLLPPPTYPAILFGLTWSLDGQWLPPFLPEAAWANWLGGVFVIIGLAAAGWAVWCFMCAGTHVEPHKPTLAMVTNGPLRLSRNPIYSSFFLLFVGMGLSLRLEWTIVLLPMLWLCLRSLVIAPEEAFLASRFGEQYQRYRQNVRRWL